MLFRSLGQLFHLTEACAGACSGRGGAAGCSIEGTLARSGGADFVLCGSPCPCPCPCTTSGGVFAPPSPGEVRCGAACPARSGRLPIGDERGAAGGGGDSGRLLMGEERGVKPPPRTRAALTMALIVVAAAVGFTGFVTSTGFCNVRSNAMSPAVTNDESEPRVDAPHASLYHAAGRTRGVYRASS